MTQISIASNITNDRVTFNNNDIILLYEFYLNKLVPDTSIIELSKSDMLLLKNGIEKLVDEGLASRKRVLSSTTTEVIYKERVHNLNFRNHDDFIVATLISAYLIFESAMSLSGHIYIYSPDSLLRHNKSDAVLAFIRGRYSINSNDLIKELMALYKNTAYSEGFDSNTISIAINYLEKLGLLYYDRILKEYLVTAKGYCLW